MNEQSDAPLVYLDANIFIYAIEDRTSEADLCRDLFGALKRRPGAGATSELSLAEVLAKPKRPRRPYLELMVWQDFIDLVPIERETLYETADLRAVQPMKLPDAIHVVTAARRRCRYFVSNDGELKVTDPIAKVAPRGSEMSRLIEELA